VSMSLYLQLSPVQLSGVCLRLSTCNSHLYSYQVCAYVCLPVTLTCTVIRYVPTSVYL